VADTAGDAFRRLGSGECFVPRDREGRFAGDGRGPRVAIDPGGEVARAAAAAGTAIGLGSFGSMPFEDVVAANEKAFFQLYWSERGTRSPDVSRREACRCQGRDRDPRLVIRQAATLGRLARPARTSSASLVAA
jgi:FMN-dependent dehydrogenase